MEPPPSLPATCIPDRFPERSSLNGIASALLAARSPWVAVFACDAPRICAELLAYMAGLRHGVEADVFLVADDNGIEQPFHALWRAGAAGRIEEAILRGELGIRRLIAGMKTRIITPNEWRRFDSTGTFITNINTPDQWRDYIGSEDSGPT
jgi:molybdopterin-guanine dinucleotide biosynthesis protein A